MAGLPQNPPISVDARAARLCDTCSVIRFQDEDLRAVHVVEQDDTTMSLNIKAGRIIPLDYEVVDFFPSLPCLEQSAKGGCDFCFLLRSEIIRAKFDYRGYISITLVYHWGDLRFPGVGLAALVAELHWRPDIPSIPPSTDQPDILRDCIIFTLETDDSAVASWLHIPRLRNKETICEPNIQFMKREIDQCISNCQHSDPTEFLPTRLLDLQAENGADYVRLVITSELLKDSCPGKELPKYAALSYCWGNGESQLCTERGSLEIRKSGIIEPSMPQVHQDAIRVCRSLSLRYLWIDSLCILQDDASDWEQESASMDRVYENALVTICNLSSSSCREGFLERNRRKITVPFESCLHVGISGQYSLVASGTCRNRVLLGWPRLDLIHSAWVSRGWTLQEHMLSSRVLLFGESMIHFSCQSGTVSENGCRGLGTEKPGCDIQALGSARSDSSMTISIYHDSWRLHVVSSYGERNYTNSQDRLPGISGLAKKYSDLYGDKYLAGVWEKDMPFALMWFPYTHSNPEYHIEMQDLGERLYNPNPYIAPSWSPLRLHGVRVEYGLRYNGGRLFDATTISAECVICEARTVPTGQNLFGRVQHGLLRVRARLAEVPSGISILPCHQFLPSIRYIENRGTIIAYCNIDCSPDKTVPREDLFMLLMASAEGTESWRESLHRKALELSDRCECGRGPISEQSSTDEEDSTVTSSSNYAASRIPHPQYTTHEASSDGGSSSQASTTSDGDSEHESVDGRDAYGLLLYRPEQRDQYIRVGVWASVVGDGGGMGYYEQFETREVEII